MKILFFGRHNKSEMLSGPEKVAKRIFSSASTKNQCVFVQYFFEGNVYSLMQKMFGCIEEHEGNLKIYRLGIFRIIPFVLRFRPDIIHVITFERFALLGYICKIFSGVKIIYNVHGVAIYENNELKSVPEGLKLKDSFCEKIFMKFSSVLLFLSRFELNIARKYYNIPERKICYVSNGIDEEFSKAKTGSSNIIPSIVFIGDSERRDKNFQFLYSALDKVKFQCRLYIVGSFNTKIFDKKFENVEISPIQKMNKEALVKFLSDKDIFVSPSFYDTFSIAAAECMAVGLVPVVSENTGISKFITKGVNGFVAATNDESDLAEKLNFLLSSKELRIKLSSAASEIYKELNWNKVFTEYSKIYDNALVG
ncbi:MAG: glycosyltransferase family 4 protein [Bacteroidetes bacterium]|nr:glycosyltransferase family 4 protein [Bacteroidota bacterium]